jgi:hypothetical protein
MGVNIIDGAIHELVEKVAGKELGWDTGLMADMPDGIEEELRRKGIHVQYRDVNLCRRRKPLSFSTATDCPGRTEAKIFLPLTCVLWANGKERKNDEL